MKKVLGLALAMALGSASVSLAADKKMELGIGGGIALNTTAGYDLGFGGAARGLFSAGENFGIGASVGFRTFSVTGLTGTSTSEIEIEALGKYTFGQSNVKPYVLVGAGFAISSISVAVPILGSISVSSTDPMISGGLGLAFPAGDTMSIFVQGTASIVLTSGSSSTYIPVEAGLNFDI